MLVLFALAAAGCSEPPRADAQPRPVRVQTVAYQAVEMAQSYTGVVRARHETDLAFRVGGKIVARLVEVGEQVVAGQTLARLDPQDFRSAMQAAEAELAGAEATLRQAAADEARYGTLLERGHVSAAEYDRRKAAADTARERVHAAGSQLAIARNRLAYTSLDALDDGVVTAIPTEVGQVVAEGQLVMRMVRGGAREVVVDIPEGRFAGIREATALVSLWSEPGRTYAAQLREVSPQADPVSRTYAVRYTIIGAGPTAELGMTATVHLARRVQEPVAMLPRSALFSQGEHPAVWVVDPDSGRLTLTPVTPKEYRQETVLLAGGVRPGDLVVTMGVQKLDAGQLVRIAAELP